MNALRSNAGAILLTAAFLFVWEFGVRLFNFPEYILPPISKIFARMWLDRQDLLVNSVPTLYAIVGGFMLAVVFGFLLAVPIAYSKIIHDAVSPILVGVQVIPKVALAPLFLVWFGFGLTPKVVIAALIAFFPVVINTTKGLRSTDQEMIQWMRSLGASHREIFFKIALPNALPYIFAALKVSIGLAVVGAVTGEFIGADKGLGRIIIYAEVNLDTTYMFGGLIAVSFLGIVLYGLIAMLEHWLLSWQVAVETAPETM